MTTAQVKAAFDGAEDIADPLDGLAEKVAADPGAPFAPEVLGRLCELKREDRAAFEAASTAVHQALPKPYRRPLDNTFLDPRASR